MDCEFDVLEAETAEVVMRWVGTVFDQELTERGLGRFLRLLLIRIIYVVIILQGREDEA